MPQYIVEIVRPARGPQESFRTASSRIEAADDAQAIGKAGKLVTEARADSFRVWMVASAGESLIYMRRKI